MWFSHGYASVVMTFVFKRSIIFLFCFVPQHFLCDPGISLPRMEVTFSMARLNKLEGECKQYMKAVQTMYNQLQEQREKEVLFSF